MLPPSKRKNVWKTTCMLLTCTMILAGYSSLCRAAEAQADQAAARDAEYAGTMTEESGALLVAEKSQVAVAAPDTKAEPEIVEVDWSSYFNGLNGTAVIYDAASPKYTMYNRELAFTRSSPCSTFKIISSLIGLENGIIDPKNSTRPWSGEKFWLDAWNQDIDFFKAFRFSCVWYFRQVVDDIGKTLMQKELARLHYGNGDISDWHGRLNTYEDNPVLTGFWLESSLKISPQEQVEVLERIFGKDSEYSEKSQQALKQAMLIDTESSEISIYGKTGMGKDRDTVVDAWFTGFAEKADQRIYFCVRLARTDGADFSSPQAREIALKLVSVYFEP